MDARRSWSCFFLRKERSTRFSGRAEPVDLSAGGRRPGTSHRARPRASPPNTTTPRPGILGRNSTNRRATSRVQQLRQGVLAPRQLGADSTATTPWATAMPSVAAAPTVWWSAGVSRPPGRRGGDMPYWNRKEEASRTGPDRGGGPARTRRIRSRTPPLHERQVHGEPPGEHVHGEEREHADDGEDRRACDA